MLASMLNYVTISSVTSRVIRVNTEKKMTADILTKNKEKLAKYLKDFWGRNLVLEVDFTDTEEKENKELTMEAIQKEVPELAKLIKDTNSKIINRIAKKKDF